MFAFCTEWFRMSEAVAARRIRAGRATCRFPYILKMIAAGELHLSGVHQLAAYLTEENHKDVLGRAKHRTMREVEALIAEIAPKPDVAASVRALPVGRAGGTPARGAGGRSSSATHLAATSPEATHAADAHSRTSGPAMDPQDAELATPLDRTASPPRAKPRGTATPLAPRRYKLQVTIGQQARDKLEELQGLLSHQIPDGDPAAIVERALEVLLIEAKKKKAALTEKARGSSRESTTRAIPARVRREVFKRDEGRCAYRDGQGRRCASTTTVRRYSTR